MKFQYKIAFSYRISRKTATWGRSLSIPRHIRNIIYPITLFPASASAAGREIAEF